MKFLLVLKFRKTFYFPCSIKWTKLFTVQDRHKSGNKTDNTQGPLVRFMTDNMQGLVCTIHTWFYNKTDNTIRQVRLGQYNLTTRARLPTSSEDVIISFVIDYNLTVNFPFVFLLFKERCGLLIICHMMSVFSINSTICIGVPLTLKK